LLWCKGKNYFKLSNKSANKFQSYFFIVTIRKIYDPMISGAGGELDLGAGAGAGGLGAGPALLIKQPYLLNSPTY
jgi:hypothetical protein